MAVGVGIMVLEFGFSPTCPWHNTRVLGWAQERKAAVIRAKGESKSSWLILELGFRVRPHVFERRSARRPSSAQRASPRARG